jgi:hypothetical protein
MSISSLTKDRANSLNIKVIELNSQLEGLIKTSPEEMWIDDLRKLEIELLNDLSYKK